MSDSLGGMTLKKILPVLRAYAAESLAGSWDNVGLLVEPSSISALSQKNNITNIMVTNDLTRVVMDEAMRTNTNMIISYHPPIFSPMKCLTQSSWKQSLIIDCIQQGIAVYSPHTALDAITNGSNDYLLKPFEGLCKPIEPICEGSSCGTGRIIQLAAAMPLDTAVNVIKQHLQLSSIRLARSPISPDEIKSIAVCAGSGASVLKGVKADLYITGEMSHHDTLDAVHNKSHVICCEHTNTERQFLTRQYVPDLQHLLPACHVFMSCVDIDPFQYV